MGKNEINDMSLYEIDEKSELINQLKKHLPEQLNLILEIETRSISIYHSFLVYSKILYSLYNKHYSFYEGEKSYEEVIIDKSLGFDIPMTYTDYSLEYELSSLLFNIEYNREKILSVYIKDCFSNKSLNEILNSNVIQILYDKEVINVSKFIFSKEDWVKIVEHDLSITDQKDSSKITFLINNSASELDMFFGTSTILKKHNKRIQFVNEEDIDKSYISVPENLAEKDNNKFNEIEIKFLPEEFIKQIPQALAKNAKKLEEESKLILKKRKEDKRCIKIERIVDLVQLFFKKNLKNYKLISDIDKCNINSKIENTIRESIKSNYEVSIPESEERIDFIDTKELRDQFISLISILDRDFNLFDHPSYKRTKKTYSLNGAKIARYFCNYIISNNSKVTITEAPLTSLINKKAKNTDLYDSIHIKERHIKEFLYNSSEDNKKLEKNILSNNQ